MNGNRELRKPQSGKGWAPEIKKIEILWRPFQGVNSSWLNKQDKDVELNPTKQREEPKETFSKSEVWRAVFLQVTEREYENFLSNIWNKSRTLRTLH